MKHIMMEFLRRGVIACGSGPLILVVVYLFMQHNSVVDTLSVNSVCIGLVSLSVLAFIAGGMNVIYQIEQLPLMAAISIHGGVLYISYLATYLVNGWLDWGIEPLLVFTGIFAVGYLLIWAVIYTIIKRSTAEVNEALKKRQQNQA